MLQVHRGKVKFFNRTKGFGFIKPNEGSADVFFHVQYYSGLSEKYSGELEMEFDEFATLCGEYHPPEEGEEIVFNILNRADKGPLAVHWMFADTWELANSRLAERPGHTGNHKVRIIRNYRDGQLVYPYEVVWEGYDDEFRKKLDEGLPEVLSEEHAFEELTINNEWERMWHPSEWHPKYKRVKNVSTAKF